MDATASVPLQKRMTVEEWGRLEDDGRFELVDGQIEEKPPVAAWHEWLMSNLLCSLTLMAFGMGKS